MKIQTGHFEGAKRAQLFYKAWLPESPPKAALTLVHGGGEYIDRYKNLVEVLAPAGFILTGYDQRGHGRSGGQRGHINSWQEYREDLGIFLRLARILAPDLPLFLYGHSQGSLEVLDYILHYPEGLAGAIISGAALTPKESVPTYLVLLAKTLSGIVPSFSAKVKLDSSTLSRDPQVTKAYKEDPLVHRRRSARWGTESLKVVEQIKIHAGEIHLPVLFLHGECDPLESAEGVQHFFEQLPSSDKTIHIYPGGRHEPHNDLVYKQVILDIESWINIHIAIESRTLQTHAAV